MIGRKPEPYDAKGLSALAARNSGELLETEANHGDRKCPEETVKITPMGYSDALSRGLAEILALSGVAASGPKNF